jgi:hypothetical protein
MALLFQNPRRFQEVHECARGPCPTAPDSSSLSVKLKLIYYRQSVVQSALVSDTHLGPATDFSFSLKFPLDIRGFVIL